ncbi:ABC transporter ATP-binding protein [Naasia lichenicola]|uniref:ABC transporter ATP-binding protein n=1 Tax=Naasia lichenicola TaxID=2565933 RepID=A0A4S4FUK2_9MICO|nr:ABC transporter ATP-binding protein [Naasia lichenicola]THG33505.1 ABC transporter ATP-binding protein [Naasia lichenicola]
MTGNAGSNAFAPGALAIETHGLTKRFGSHLAVDSVDLAVPRGSVFGFLGPNGAGKTTTIRMLLGLVGATSGSISVLGQPMPASLASVLPRVGALVEGPAFYPFLSGAANLHRLDTADRSVDGATRSDRVAQALDRVGLGHAAGKKVKAYSLGMKQRLGLANALLAPRDLLVLDEPSNGLDPQGTREVRSLIRSLAADGTTVFVSSHLLAEIEQLCSHVAVMSSGRIVSQGTLDAVRDQDVSRIRVVTTDPVGALRVLADFGLEPSVATDESTADGDVRVVLAPVPATDPGHRTSGIQPEAIVAALVAAGVPVRGFTVEESSLEDRFVALTGEGFAIAEGHSVR